MLLLSMLACLLVGLAVCPSFLQRLHLDIHFSHQLCSDSVSVCRMCGHWHVPAVKLHGSCMQPALFTATFAWPTLCSWALLLTWS